MKTVTIFSMKFWRK